MKPRFMLLAVVALLAASGCGSDEDATISSGSGSGSGAAGTSAGGGGPGSGGAGGGSSSGGAGNAPAECPHTGPDVLDPSTLPPCPMCGGGAHCVPNALIPPEFQSQLGDCDAKTKCVPDDFIKSGGNFIAPTCTSIAGAEGRCVSECLPQIAAQASLLPADTCAEFQKCAPCYDPIKGTETGACSLSCDPGPTQPPVQLPTCCKGIGTCVPKGAVPPEQAAQLPVDSCPMDANDYVCAPTVFITDPTYKPTPCTTEIIIGGGKPGVCLPGCLLTGFQGSLVGQSTCDPDWKCAPCDDPLSGQPTGACDLGG